MKVRFVRNAEVPNVGEWGAGDEADVPTEVGYSLIASGHAVDHGFGESVNAEAVSDDIIIVDDGVGVEIERADDDEREEED